MPAVWWVCEWVRLIFLASSCRINIFEQLLKVEHYLICASLAYTKTGERPGKCITRGGGAERRDQAFAIRGWGREDDTGSGKGANRYTFRRPRGLQRVVVVKLWLVCGFSSVWFRQEACPVSMPFLSGRASLKASCIHGVYRCFNATSKMNSKHHNKTWWE